MSEISCFSNNCYKIEPSSIIPAFLCFTIGNKEIKLGPKEITYSGYENADDATVAFLESLVKYYPSFVEMIKNG